MRKILMFTIAASLAATALVSCNEDDNKKDEDIVTGTDGVYILTQGNYQNKIEGGLNYLDYKTEKMSYSVFSAVNGRSIGNTPQCGIAYGSKIYVGTEMSNTVEIIDRNTFRSIKQISLASEPGQQPRSMVAKEGKVYISMYNGYISRLDTLTNSIDGTVKVGPNPDKIAIQGHYIYVPNSDGMSWNTTGYGKTASMVDIDSFTETRKFDVPQNPTEFFSNGVDLFLLCSGNYADEKAAVYAVNPMTQAYTKVAEATMAAVDNNNLYLINAITANDMTFRKINLNTGATTEMLADSSEIGYPSGLAVDPVTGSIFIGSFKVSQWGYGDYDSPSSLVVYDYLGRFIKRFDNMTPGPADIFFSTK